MTEPQTPEQFVARVAQEFTDSEGWCPAYDVDELRCLVRARDAQVRAAALEEAAKWFETRGGQMADFFADAIRDLARRA